MLFSASQAEVIWAINPDRTPLECATSTGLLYIYPRRRYAKTVDLRSDSEYRIVETS